jgi:hypothetical protein
MRSVSARRSLSQSTALNQKQQTELKGRSQLHWKFDLVIAALIRVLTEAGKPYALLKSNHPEDVEATTQQLVSFLSLGMRS